MEYKQTDQHRQAFEYVKQLLTKGPLFNNLIDEQAEKFLWVDAASSSSVLGAVLAQKIKVDPSEKALSLSIDLEDEVHRMIYDKKTGL